MAESDTVSEPLSSCPLSTPESDEASTDIRSDSAVTYQSLIEAQARASTVVLSFKRRHELPESCTLLKRGQNFGMQRDASPRQVTHQSRTEWRSVAV